MYNSGEDRDYTNSSESAEARSTTNTSAGTAVSGSGGETSPAANLGDSGNFNPANASNSDASTNSAVVENAPRASVSLQGIGLGSTVNLMATGSRLVRNAMSAAVSEVIAQERNPGSNEEASNQGSSNEGSTVVAISTDDIGSEQADVVGAGTDLSEREADVV